MFTSRRSFLKLAATGAVTGAASFTLPRLSLAQSDDVFTTLTASEFDKKLYRPEAGASKLWGIDKQSPGPVIRAKAGEQIKIRFQNELPEPSSLHWHGIRIENAMDGVSGLTQDPVLPGESFDYVFTAPDAGTYWYHAHNKSWNQVARGLYGALIIDGDTDSFDRDHDLTLVLDDWRLGQNGELDTDSIGSLMDWSHGGRLGNWLTVNGEPRPNFQLRQDEPYRLRLINAANARILAIDLDSISAELLGYDGQVFNAQSQAPYAPIFIGPSQRMDLVITPKTTSPLTLSEVSGDDAYPLATFDVSAKREFRAVPVVLKPNMLPEPDLNKARSIKLVMSGGAMGRGGDIVYKGKVLEGEDFRDTGQVWAFNGVANLAKAPFFDAVLGESIVLEVVNQTAFAHAMHVHGHHFRILERQDSQVDEGKPWRDTFLIGPDQTTKIAFVADNPGKWLFHCHMLEHAAAGMNTWFNVQASS